MKNDPITELVAPEEPDEYVDPEADLRERVLADGIGYLETLVDAAKNGLAPARALRLIETVASHSRTLSSELGAVEYDRILGNAAAPGPGPMGEYFHQLTGMLERMTDDNTGRARRSELRSLMGALTEARAMAAGAGATDADHDLVQKLRTKIDTLLMENEDAD